MSDDSPLVRRTSQGLRPDPRRVISKLFLPGQEMLSRGVSRADAVTERILTMAEADVVSTLADTLARFADRHHDLRAVFAEHFEQMSHRVPPGVEPSDARKALIGAYFTSEFAIESAALFNPSMVARPDQSGLAEGLLGFIMSVRAVGEGHISSIEFRTGVIGPSGEVSVDEPGDHLNTGRASPTKMSRTNLRQALVGHADPSDIDHVLGLLPAWVDSHDLEVAIGSVRRDQLTRGSADAMIERMRWLASCHYTLEFPPGRHLSERVIHPTGPDESHGVEDARLTRFVETDGSVTYYATYTAFDGSQVSQHLAQTDDFRTFDMTRLVGAAAQDKGMALFPRRVGGAYLALTRYDRETIGVASSTDARNWTSGITVQVPTQPWETIQLGNCGPPIETQAGWLVLTHGVGPMRSYSIGAILLDLEQPSRLLGALDRPLMAPNELERNGYVPNVVYSCGAMVHHQVLVIPYGCSDYEIRFACVDLPELLARLLASGPDSVVGPTASAGSA